MLFLPKINPKCHDLDQWLHIHIPKCEYCQGFLICLFENTKNRKDSDSFMPS